MTRETPIASLWWGRYRGFAPHPQGGGHFRFVKRFGKKDFCPHSEIPLPLAPAIPHNRDMNNTTTFVSTSDLDSPSDAAKRAVLYANYGEALGERDSFARCIARSVVKGETPDPTLVRWFIIAEEACAMHRIMS